MRTLGAFLFGFALPVAILAFDQVELSSQEGSACVANSGKLSRTFEFGAAHFALRYLGEGISKGSGHFGVGFGVARMEILEGAQEGEPSYSLEGLNCREELSFNSDLNAYQTRFGSLRFEKVDSSSFRVLLDSGAYWILEKLGSRYLPVRKVSASGLYYTEYLYEPVGGSHRLQAIQVGKKTGDPTSPPLGVTQILYGHSEGLASEVRVMGPSGALMNRYRFNYKSEIHEGQDYHFLSRVTEMGTEDSALPSLTMLYGKQSSSPFFGLMTEVKTPLGGKTLYRYSEHGVTKVPVLSSVTRFEGVESISDVELAYGGGTLETGFEWVESKSSFKNSETTVSRVTYHTEPVLLGLPRESRIEGSETPQTVLETYYSYATSGNQVWLERVVSKKETAGKAIYTGVDYDYDSEKDRINKVLSYADVSYDLASGEIQDLDSQDTSRIELEFLDAHGLARNLVSRRKTYLGGTLSGLAKFYYEHAAFPFLTKSEAEVDAGSILGASLISTVVYDDETGKPFQTYSPSGVVTHFDYDEFGRLESRIEGPLVTVSLSETNWKYDPVSGLVDWIRYPSGNEVFLDYDDHQRLIGQDVLPFGIVKTHTASLEYDDAQRLLTVHSGPVEEVRTHYRSFDEWGRLVKTTLKEDDGSLLASRLNWDGSGRLESQSFPPATTTSALADADLAPLNSLQFDYDSLGRLTGVSPEKTDYQGSPNGLAPMGFDFSDPSEVLSSSAGVVTRLTRKLSVLEFGLGDPSLGEELVYQSMAKDGGKRLEFVDGGGNTFHIERDSLGRPTGLDLPASTPIQKIEYDQEFVKKVELPGGNRGEVVARDLLGRPLVIRFTKSGSKTEEIHYYWESTFFQEAKVPAGELGALEKFVENDSGEMVSVDRVEYSYQGSWIDHFVHTVEGSTAQIQYFRDPKTFEIQRISYYHPEMGAVTARYIRDSLGRQKEVRVQVGPDPLKEMVVAIVESRNEAGLIKSQLYPNKELRHSVEFSDVGPTSVQYVKTDGTVQQSFSTAYHSNGHIAQRLLLDKDGVVETRTFDPTNSRGQPVNWSQISPLKTVNHEREYDSLGRLKKDKGLSLELKYENTSHPYGATSMTASGDGGVHNYIQHYNQNRSIASASGPGGGTTYTYSASSRLIRAKSSLSQEELRLTYGALGNAIARERTTKNGLQTKSLFFGLRDIIQTDACEFTVRVPIETPPQSTGSTTSYYDLKMNVCQTHSLAAAGPLVRFEDEAGLPFGDPPPRGGGGGGTRPKRPGGGGGGGGGPGGGGGGPLTCPDGTIQVVNYDANGNPTPAVDKDGNPICVPVTELTIEELISYVLPEQPPTAEEEEKEGKPYIWEPGEKLYTDVLYIGENYEDPCADDITIGVLDHYDPSAVTGLVTPGKMKILVNPDVFGGQPFIRTTLLQEVLLSDMINPDLAGNLGRAYTGNPLHEGGLKGIGGWVPREEGGYDVVFAQYSSEMALDGLNRGINISVSDADHPSDVFGPRASGFITDGTVETALDAVGCAALTKLTVQVTAVGCRSAASRVGYVTMGPTKRLDTFMSRVLNDARGYSTDEMVTLRQWYLKLTPRQQRDALRMHDILMSGRTREIQYAMIGRTTEQARMENTYRYLRNSGAHAEDIAHVYDYVHSRQFIDMTAGRFVADHSGLGLRAHRGYGHLYQGAACAEAIGVRRTLDVTATMTPDEWIAYTALFEITL